MNAESPTPTHHNCPIKGSRMTASEQPELAFDLREITGTSTVEDTFRFRYEVWSGQIELALEVQSTGIISDLHDVHARHWAVFVGENMVASARMCIHEFQDETPDEKAFREIKLPSPIATINRLVVHKTARGFGLSRHLDACRINAARQQGANCMVGTASKERIDGLQRMGFRLTPFTFNHFYSPSCTFYGMILFL
jgi:GNAT superfamily N-acetyltransferase